jgi:hypothetical protein
MTQQQTKTHWKQFHNPDYIGAYALNPGEEIVLTIKGSGVEEVYNTNNKKEQCHVIRFVEDAKPMIVNVTNAKLISKVVGSHRVEDWVGHKIQLYATVVKAFGEEVEAIRVRPFPPKIGKKKEELTESHKKWADVVRKVADGTPLEVIDKHFTVSDEAKALLFEQAAELSSAVLPPFNNETGEID